MITSICVIALVLATVSEMKAQTFKNLHNFTGIDGNNPVELTLSGNILYVTMTYGGSSGSGALSAVNTDGSCFTNLYNFPAVDPNTCANSDGAYPTGGLILSDDTLYGTVTYGGSAGNGALSAIKANGTGFTNLYNFSAVDPDTGVNCDGAYPGASLILSGNTLYGTAQCGGSSGSGTVFKINNDGSGFARLYSFSSIDPDTSANSDGACPNASLILSGNTLYGTAQGGGSGNGTVFRINTDGSGFKNLYSFTATHLPASGSLFGPTNGDGACPSGGLILSGNTLYGTASRGGESGNGTIFAINTDGSGFTNLHSFTGVSIILSGSTYVFSNSDGTVPAGNLIYSSNTLYGTTSRGGNFGSGAVFAINRDGTCFTNLHNFAVLNPTTSTNSDGANPSGLILSGGILYGTTSAGGYSRSGTVFSLSLASVSPLLTITCSGSNVILSWPDAATGFRLQSTTNLVAPLVWTTVSGQFAVTNQMTDTQRFYRLAQ
jgi:uncharacterized repeat protein (TIGR03803 family)